MDTSKPSNPSAVGPSKYFNMKKRHYSQTEKTLRSENPLIKQSYAMFAQMTETISRPSDSVSSFATTDKTRYNLHLQNQPKMKSFNVVFLLIIITNGPIVESAVLEALIQVESDNLQMSSFLERFKKFIIQSHGTTSTAINEENNTSVDKYIQHNDTFQANYDFSQNLLTIRSSYTLLQNKTGEKISDVKISINFRFDQDPNRKIVIEDFHGHDAVPRIGIDNITIKEFVNENKNDENYQIHSSILGSILSPIVNVIEPIIVTFFHIVINGILGHVLTTAFEELYHGRLLSH